VKHVRINGDLTVLLTHETLVNSGVIEVLVIQLVIVRLVARAILKHKQVNPAVFHPVSEALNSTLLIVTQRNTRVISIHNVVINSLEIREDTVRSLM